MRFGAHTVTHPILARTSNSQSRHEIERSWQRLSGEVSQPVPVFCYPNGKNGDFGRREIATIRDLGLRGAVTAEPGYATDAAHAESDGLFRIPRFCLSDSHSDNIRYASGLEWLRQRARLP